MFIIVRELDSDWYRSAGAEERKAGRDGWVKPSSSAQAVGGYELYMDPICSQGNGRRGESLTQPRQNPK